MTIQDYNFMVASTLKVIRELSRKSQHEMAKILNTTQSNYCKIECGLRPISIGHLYHLTKALDTSIFQVLALVEAKNKLEYCPTTLSSMLSNFIKKCDGKHDKEEIDRMIALIRNSFEVEDFKTSQIKSKVLTNYS